MVGAIEKGEMIRRLCELFLECPIHQVIPYNKIDEIIGTDRYLMYEAKKQCNQSDGCIFETVNKIGLRRLRSGEAYKIGQKARNRIRKTARMASTQIGLAITNGNDVTNEEILNASAEQRILGLHVQLSHQKSVDKQKIEIMVETESVADAARIARNDLATVFGRKKTKN